MSRELIAANRRQLRDNIIFFSDVNSLRAPVYGLTNQLQGHKPHLQLLSLGVSLFMLCEATGINVRDVLTVAENATYDVDSPFSHQVNALKAYAEGELLGGTPDAFGT